MLQFHLKGYRSLLLYFCLSSFHNQHLPKMAGNGSTADEQELREALRLNMEVDNDATNGTGSQANSTTEAGGTQPRPRKDAIGKGL